MSLRNVVCQTFGSDALSTESQTQKANRTSDIFRMQSLGYFLVCNLRWKPVGQSEPLGIDDDGEKFAEDQSPRVGRW